MTQVHLALGKPMCTEGIEVVRGEGDTLQTFCMVIEDGRAGGW